MTGFGWADNPALPRLRDLDPCGESPTSAVVFFCRSRNSEAVHMNTCCFDVLSLTLNSVRLRVLYGSESWMTHLTVDDFTAAGVAGEGEVNYIEGAGHHIYSDQPELFNTTLNKILEQLDC